MCGCESWRKTQFPCKHFYAVFNTFEEWQFTSLPDNYTNSVFITMDTNTDVKTYCEKRKIDQVEGCEDRIETSTNNVELQINDDGKDVTTESKQLESTNSEAVQQMESSRLRKSLIEKLNFARDCAFNVDDRSRASTGSVGIRR